MQVGEACWAAGRLVRHDHCTCRVAEAPRMLQVAWVPGSFEIPLIAKAMARSRKYDAILTLGAVVRPAAASWSHLLAMATQHERCHAGAWLHHPL